MRHRREQDLAAEASVQRIQVKLADRCLGDGVGPRVPPGRADQLRHQQLVEVRISLPVDLAKRPLEDGKGIRDPVREPQRAAQLERDLTAPRPVGEELEAGPQVVDRRRAVRPPLGKAVVARRAGQIVTGTLTATGHCRYTGQVHVPATGRWFLYVELQPRGFEVEAWLPVDASSPNRLVQHRQLYLPAGRTQGARFPGSEVAAGIALYGLGALLLALIVRHVRGPARTQPVLHAEVTQGPATHGDGVGRWRARPGRLGS
jgi:hypothetical protein